MWSQVHRLSTPSESAARYASRICSTVQCWGWIWQPTLKVDIGPLCPLPCSLRSAPYHVEMELQERSLLDQAGLPPPAQVRHNLSPAELCEHAVRRGEAVIAASGALSATTGKHTGR